MARERGGQTIRQNIEVLHAAPIDARTQVRTFSDLTDPLFGNPDNVPGMDTSYKYMRVFVEDEQQEYILKGDNYQDRNSWEPYGGGGGNTPSTPGDSYLDNALEATVNVGGVKAGDNFAKGKDFEELFRAMLAPVLPPTITQPSAKLRNTSGNRTIYGYDETIGTQNFTVDFNRGTISSGGNTAGAATGYNIGGVVSVGNSAALDIDALMGTNTTFSVSASVNYGEGDQPKNSDGSNYGSPKPAGSVNASPAITFEKRRYIYATKDNDGVLKRLDIQTHSSSPVQVLLAHPYPASAQVALPVAATKIEWLNTLNNQWEDCTSGFVQSTTSLDGITYQVYTDKRTASAGARDLKFYF